MTIYFTTPLYYVNDTPHIGHAYTTVIADVLARYHRLFGHETLFLTGTDEHGQKIQTAAHRRGVDPQEHCDEFALNFQNIWKELNIKYDIFYRTTADFHKKAVQACLQKLWDKGEIYSAEYEGWYSVSEEIFYTEKDLVDGKSPQGREVTRLKETNYFFKMSKYQDRLIEYIKNNLSFIEPESKRNEVLGFLSKPLHDLNISRTKSRMSWGIDLPFDNQFVTYVWFDALLNYAVAVGLERPGMEADLKKWWPNAVHLLGKDILTTHAVYWPTMLMALDVPMPKKIFAHGWWLTDNNEKMSKSTGPTVKPLDMKNIVGVDGLRYFLTRDISFGNDAQFSEELVINRVNSELANNLGNLFSRSTNLIAKFFAGRMPKATLTNPATQALKTQAENLAQLVKTEIEDFSPNKAVGHVVDLLNAANKFMEEQAPWKQLKDGQTAAGAETLTAALEVLRISGILLSPVMPEKMSKMLELIGSSGSASFAEASKWGLIPEGTAIAKAEPLFPRIETAAKG